MNLFDEQAFQKTWINIFSTLGVDSYKNELDPSSGIYGVNNPVPIIFFNSKQYNKGISSGNRILSKTPNGKIIFPGKDITNNIIPGIMYKDLKLIHYDNYTVTTGKDLRNKEYWLYLFKENFIKAIKLYRSLYLKYNPNLGLREAKNIVDKDRQIISLLLPVGTRHFSDFFDDLPKDVKIYITFLQKDITQNNSQDDPFFVPDTQIAPKARNNLRNSFKAKGTLTYNDIAMNVVNNIPPTTIKDIFVDPKKDDSKKGFNIPKVISESTGVDISERIEILEAILIKKEEIITNLENINLDKQRSIHKLKDAFSNESQTTITLQRAIGNKNLVINKLKDEVYDKDEELINLYNDLEDLINRQQTQNPVSETKDNKEINVWNIIGCNPKDNKDFILTETYKAIKSYHPDKVNNAGFLIKEYANEILKNLLSFKKRIS